MNVKTYLGFLLAFALGALCALLKLPLPAPPVLIGALLVVSMTLGYSFVDRIASQRACANKQHCGGPTG
ncbi:MAG: XapX domain-containing protein [Pseudomonadota bacterium]